MEKILSVVWKRNTELLNLFACCGKVRSGDDDDGGNGNIVVLQKKSINNDVDNVFGFPASNKGNLLFIQINYLFCAVELCVGGDWRDEQEGFDG